MTTIRIVQTFRELNRAQWLPIEELRRRSETRLSRLLRHAVENVPFYRGLDRNSLPVMDKSAYRSHAPEAFAASNLPAQRRIEKATSGSTGVPFRFAVDRAALPVAFASQLSYDSWIGLRPYKRCLRIAVPPPPGSGGLRTLPWLQRVYDRWTQDRMSVWDTTRSGPRTSGGASRHVGPNSSSATLRRWQPSRTCCCAALFG